MPKVLKTTTKKESVKTAKKAPLKETKKVPPKVTKKAPVKVTKKAPVKVTKKAIVKVTEKASAKAGKVIKKVAAKISTKGPKIKDKAIQNLVDTIISGIQDIKGKDLVILDLTKLQNAVTDYFIIATGDSSTQVEGMASAVVRKTRKELRERPWHEEGVGNSEWILLDYVNVVVHIFYRETREFYNLEDLWADAERTDIANLD